MKAIKESKNPARWPRNKVESVECRKRDLVIRIANWMSDKEEPAYDVECYIGGVYDWNESESFTVHANKTQANCKKLAIEFSQKQIAKLL